MTDRSTTRRTFLRAAGVTLALPMLESAIVRGAPSTTHPVAPPRRMVAVCFALGLHGPNFFPAESGRGYTLTPYLEAVGKNFTDQMTVISGLSHPEVTLGHASDASFLTAARFRGSGTFRNTISLDQLMVEKLRPDTRFPSLVLGTRNGSISYSRSGVQIPGDSKPSNLFSKLFVNGSASEVAGQVRRLKEGQSVMDTVLGPAKRLNDRISAPDRDRLDQYFTAIREVEQRLVSNQEWATRPRPKVDYKKPADVADPNDDVTRLKLMLDLIHLAFQTDSTRFVTLYVTGSNGVQPIPGVSVEYHSLSHHGQDPQKLAQLRLIQIKQMEAVGDFMGKLRQTKEQSETLLDRTMLMFGSAMGNASSHNTRNLPIVLAGGGFRHGQRLAFDQDNNTPLCRLYVSMLQRMGIEADQFASGKGTLPGVEMV
jgi:hypothetical protein